MKVREWIKRLEIELNDYLDMDINDDALRHPVDGSGREVECLMDALETAVSKNTDLRIKYTWDYDF